MSTTKRYSLAHPGICSECAEAVEPGEAIALVGGELDRHWVCDACADNHEHEEEDQ